MKRGSMTATLGLVLLVILSLLAATFRSARVAAGRVALASGTEQGLYSLFASYDRTLFSDYGLLFCHVGGSDGAPDLGAALSLVEDGASYSCQPNRDRWFGNGKDILGMELTGASVLGYTLATDGGGAPFREQVCEVMRQNLGTAGIAALRSRLTEESSIRDEIVNARAEITEDRAEEYYAEDVAARGEEAEEPEVPENFENPIASVNGLKKLGILGLTVPDSTASSAGEADRATLASGRDLQQGMGLMEFESPGLDDKLLLQEYLVQFFPSYTDGDDGAGLRYQVEYAIGGKGSDRENLTRVVRELLLIREASNMIHVMRSPEKRAQADSVAWIVSLLLLSPQTQPVISFFIKTSWAYAESIMDVRKLLSGGRIPLWKTADTWQVGLLSIATTMLGFDPPDLSVTSRGLNYEEYLRLLLLARSTEKLTDSLMDLTEMNVRRVPGKENFRLDACLASIEVELRAEIAGQELTITRSYRYDEE